MAGDEVSFSDWLALSEAKARYCRFLDSKDWESFGNLMREDFEMDVSEGTGVPVVTGRDTAVETIRSSVESAVTAHQVHSPEISITGDEATVIWAMQDRVIWDADELSLTGYGHYHERWLRVGAEWKLAALKLTRLHLEIKAVTGDSSAAGQSGAE